MALGNLSESIWAKHYIHINQPTHSPGDWDCSSCRFRNYYWRFKCTKCNQQYVIDKYAREHTIASAPRQQLSSGSKETRSIPSTDSKSRASTLLSFSKNISNARDLKKGTRLEVDHKSHQIPIFDKRKSKGHSIPYQVQHHILTSMQKMLEESCYEFALKWIPEFLREREFDCAEAVELAQWKSFLPTELPKHALCPTSRCSLSRFLGHAVRIRNAAVHRHLCNNQIIQEMALQARDLMSMFSDLPRQDKFYYLWVIIGEWDDEDEDISIARAKLEQALKITSQKPIDKMDWTLNTNSMEDLSLRSSNSADVCEYSDEMDLDP